MNIIRQLLSKKISIKEENNQIIIDILENCSLQEYIKLLEKTKYSYLLNIIDLKYLLKNNSISPKRIILINNEDIIYIISITKDRITIAKKTISTNIIEEIIDIDKINYIYQISSLIHTLDGNTIDVKTYYQEEDKNHSFMFLPKIEALDIARMLIEEISSIPNIANHINLNETAKILNIYLEKNYFPIIQNETITLSWQNRYGSTNIYEKQRATLDIILNETKEVIGNISFNTNYNPNTSYTGNISYSIKTEYQGNHYATQALALLKEVLKNHKEQQGKPLYLSIEENNIKSQRVALNNNGELYYEGPIPKSDNLTKFSGITKIKMYKISL